MIAFKDVSFGYAGGESVLHEVSFEISRGEFVAVIGENGAGKSTVSKMMNGLLKPCSGQVLIEGLDTGTVKTSVLARKVGFLFQNPDRQICRNTVREELKFGLDLVSEEHEKNRRVQEMLKRFLLDGDSDPFLLSRGERQRVALASLLVTEPEILILDEPTTGLDYLECMDLMDAVQKLHQEKQMTVIMVCHDMEVVHDYAKRVLVMAGGRLIKDAEPGELFREELLGEEVCAAPFQAAAQPETAVKGMFAYTPGESILHKANPVMKLVLSFSICIACFLTERIPVMLGLLILDMAIGYGVGVFSKAVSLLKGLCKVCAFLFLLQIMVVREGNPVFWFMTDAGLLLAARVVLRLMGATIPLALVLAVTRMSDLSNALVAVLHIPYKYVFTLMTAVRFIPVFIGEMNSIMEAQTARGMEFDTSNILKKFRLTLPLCTPLLIASVRRADASAMAVEIRGFYLRTRNSAYRTYPFTGRDGVIGIFCLCLIGIAYITS